MNNDFVLNARNLFDFQLIPSIVLSDDVEDFIMGVINSKGEVLAEILNDTFEKVAEESGVELQTDQAFTKEDFGVVNGKVDNDRMMVLVEMPKHEGDGLHCCYYAIVYNVPARSVRFFGVAKNKNTDPSTVLFEFIEGGSPKKYGPIEPGMRKLMECVLSIVREK